MYVTKVHEKIVPMVLQSAITRHNRKEKLDKTTFKHKHPNNNFQENQ